MSNVKFHYLFIIIIIIASMQFLKSIYVITSIIRHRTIRTLDRYERARLVCQAACAASQSLSSLSSSSSSMASKMSLPLSTSPTETRCLATLLSRNQKTSSVGRPPTTTRRAATMATSRCSRTNVDPSLATRRRQTMRRRERAPQPSAPTCALCHAVTK